MNTPTLIKCQRCGGEVLTNYGEDACLQCGAYHDSEGNWIEPKVGEGKALSGGHIRIKGKRYQ